MKKRAPTFKKRLPGEALELEVERLCQLLGATTQRRSLIKNYEIDVIAQFPNGPISTTVLIECKDYTHPKIVDDKDVSTFAVKVLAARECGKADKGLMVTTSEYTKNARSTASEHNIQCLLLSHFYDGLVDFGQYCAGTMAAFETSPLNSWYIDQAASDVEDYDTMPASALQQHLHRPLVEYVDQIFSRQRERRLALLGNFGTGKTSFCYKYRYELLQRYRADPSQRLPVLINLNAYRSGFDIHRVITNQLEDLPGVNLSHVLCRELERRGRFFFILDGLDEMATRVDRAVVNENLRELDRLYEEPQNMYLITCRTHFFQERIVDDILRDYRVVYLTEWTWNDIQQYLRFRFGREWRARCAQIMNTPNLQELARTPMFLDMIAKSLAKFEGRARIGSFELYRAYTDHWIVEQSRRRGSVMKSDERRAFVEVLATKLYTESRATIHFSTLYAMAQDFSGIGDRTALDYFDADARTSTFITKDTSGQYGFRHQSFAEFFCATRMSRELKAGEPRLIDARELPREVLHFLGELPDWSEEVITKLRQWAIEFTNPTRSKNAMRLLLTLGLELDEEIISHYGEQARVEREMVEAIGSADTEALNAFIKEHWEGIKDAVAAEIERVGLEQDDVEDIVQELLLKIWDMRVRGALPATVFSDVGSAFRIWIKNIVLDRYRMQTRRGEVTLAAIGSAVDDIVDERATREIDSRILRRGLAAELKKAFATARLSKKECEILTAVYIEELSIDEVSARFHLRPQTVRQLQYRAISKIRRSYTATYFLRAYL